MRITKCRGGSGMVKGGDPCGRPLYSFVGKDKGL
jgi:hypothetical protein